MTDRSRRHFLTAGAAVAAAAINPLGDKAVGLMAPEIVARWRIVRDSSGRIASIRPWPSLPARG